MLIAHLPAGYILTKVITPSQERSISLWFTGLFFSIAPDLDVLWFYFLGDRSVPHHDYVTHWPLFWVGIFGVGMVVSAVLGKPSWTLHVRTGLAAVVLHFVLDSIGAQVYWLAPFSQFYLNAVDIPAQYGWWVWNFVLHWTFAIEVFICLAAGVVFFRSRRSRRKKAGQTGFS